jgi:hypothetical protein
VDEVALIHDAMFGIPAYPVSHFVTITPKEEPQKAVTVFGDLLLVQMNIAAFKKIFGGGLDLKSVQGREVGPPALPEPSDAR